MVQTGQLRKISGLCGCQERELRLQLKMARGRRLTTIIYEGIRALFCPSITMLCSILIFIVNNGNIFTDGRRRKPRIEMQQFILI